MATGALLFGLFIGARMGRREAYLDALRRPASITNIEMVKMSSNIAKRLLLLALAPALFMVLSAPSFQDYAPPHSQPGPATDTINFSAFDVGIASRELEAGEMDMYIFSLKTPAAEALQGNPDITVYQAPASTTSII